jgi:NADH-quinone oxidoreductase subunit A
LELDTGTFIAMAIFIIVLFVGLFYTLKKGTLDWDVKNIKYEAMKR